MRAKPLPRRTYGAQAVAGYNDYLGVIKSVHQDCSDSLDWLAMQRERAPVAPAPSTEHERAAQIARDTYAPGFFDRLFKIEQEKEWRIISGILLRRLAHKSLPIRTDTGALPPNSRSR